MYYRQHNQFSNHLDCKVTNDTHIESYKNKRTRDKNGRWNKILYYLSTHVGSYNKPDWVSIWLNNLYICLQNSYRNYLSAQPTDMTYEVDLIYNYLNSQSSQLSRLSPPTSPPAQNLSSSWRNREVTKSLSWVVI